MDEKLLRLNQKVAIITGAGSSGPGIGTGKAISILFARHGCKVVLVDNNEDRVKETLGYILADGHDAISVTGDVTSNSDCKRIVDTTISEYGRLDTLINNVGILAPGNVVTLKETDYDKVMNVNLKSMVLVSKHAIPKIIESGGGSIVNMSSFLGLRSGSIFESVPYSVSKGAIIALTTTMAAEHGREGVRVNAIAPGNIYTPMVAGQLNEKQRVLRRKAAPLGTEGTAWDVAWACLFLSSDEARWVTGAVLPVDGGLLTTSPLSMLQHLI
tara:strand:- start:24 stop:836 length:813 start_codon:yes stop_codon:yes gene_type:complete